ncbi:hypothetical protein IE53DRAFT_369041 [Violaceomyces palustris]|uniref:Uncharacterized protein n=1 Tax=Violaceomyces palustris TaxID=1673888 RepID=A0ACD0NWT0_9BASI|nr:hypothetical protein IE53DRAFT_369041 [Violaceomyces palustris]
MSQPRDIESPSSPMGSSSSKEKSSDKDPSLVGAHPMSISPEGNFHNLQGPLHHQSQRQPQPQPPLTRQHQPDHAMIRSGSAASMLQAASAIAAAASSSAEGLQAVSSALLSQAKAQAQAGGLLANSLPAFTEGDSSFYSVSDSGSVPAAAAMSKTLNDSAQYSAAMSAHVASALKSQVPEASPKQEGQAESIDPLVGASPDGVLQMSEIAARAAAKEAEAQMRTQVMLRTASQSEPTGATANSIGVQQMPGALAARRASTNGAQIDSLPSFLCVEPPMAAASRDAADQTIHAMPSSATSYLEHLGLSHIVLPSAGFEQMWGSLGASSSSAPARCWNATSPAMGYSLSGVPSMPLMPTPPLQMLPPPVSPSFSRRHSRGRRSSSNNSSNGGFFTPGSPTSTRPSHVFGGSEAEAASIRETEPNVMSPFPYPFQVVQTPGGTARAGWWVPPSEVSAERKAASTKLGRLSRGLPPRKKKSEIEALSSVTENADEDNVLDDLWQGTLQEGSSRNSIQAYAYEEDLPYFQPSFREFTEDEYAALASAAAVATAALTSTSVPEEEAAGNPDSVGKKAPSWRPLNADEQAVIAEQLRAWAGLEGPERQAEARDALEERQVHIISQATRNPLPGSASLTNRNAPVSSGSAAAQEPSNAVNFFPPDFASHYRTQLRALAEGYYTRLHNEGLSRFHGADGMAVKGGKCGDQPTQGPKTSESKPSINTHTADARQDFDPRQDQALVESRAQAQEQGRSSENFSMVGLEGQPGFLAGFSEVPQVFLSSDIKSQIPVPPPSLGPGAQDPLQLLDEASRAAGTDAGSPEVRDLLLQYAHNLYSSTQQQAAPGISGIDKLHPSLLPLLHTLHSLHPRHLPTLLLLSCAYYSADNMAGSLWYNNLILRIDPQYVESMSNIGTTLRALGRWKEAESWWWRAIRLRPGYWDAYENLLGVMCSPIRKNESEKNRSSKGNGDEVVGPRFEAALKLCEFVESHVVPLGGPPGSTSAALTSMPRNLAITQAPRLQNLYYAKGNLKYVIPEFGPVPAAREYQKAVELALSPSKEEAYSLRDLVVATCVVGLLSMGAVVPGSAAAQAAFDIALAIGVDPRDHEKALLMKQGLFHALYPGGILSAVRDSGDRIVQTLLLLGGGHLPMLMLLPEQASQLGKLIFSYTGGLLPGLAASPQAIKVAGSSGQQQAIKQASQTTSTILLTLAKLYQDATSNPVPGPHGPLTLGGIPPSISLLLPLYYLSVSLHPSASTCNNLGILLSSIPLVTAVLNSQGKHQQMNGQALAMQFYTHGLQLDPTHPHLYTNLGSLLKDLGHLNEAIRMYEKAVEFNPNFDVALANLGNAIKDQGRTQDSVVYYRRAVQANPHFPEALCGLVNALLAVCDWREVYPDDPDWAGWMANVAEIIGKQLDDGCHYGAGALQSDSQPWAQLVPDMLRETRPHVRQEWATKLGLFYQPLDRAASKINEGGFIIRLIERVMRRVQRLWYLDAFGPLVGIAELPAGIQSLPRIQPNEEHGLLYGRPKLPSCLVTPAVPTVLPFHTFTYPLSPRQIRLICHRNALRISQSALTQIWLPPHVYPPPTPPAPKINVGYISSDFNNHPLAHLMQSVFGFHDLSRFNVFLYATTPSDGSPYREKIEREAQHFIDVSSWSNQVIIERILHDNIHILMNLNGYTKGARNEVFAARPCPVQMEFMGFAGSLASGWTDWIVADPIVCPPDMTSVEKWRLARRMADGTVMSGDGGGGRPTDLGADLDPEEESEDWVYTERFIYMPHSYFVNDHAQGFREPEERKAADGHRLIHPHEMSDDEAWEEEEEKRYRMRKELFPNLADDHVIFADFNQLYKCDPMLFRLWLRILARVPKSILWLLRFPASGEPHLLREARSYAGDEVASRVIFTDVAPKHVHIHRGRIADLFLDTTECNAHTTAADILWSGTPVLTWPRHRHKMCSRVAASIVQATGFGDEMIVHSEEEYEERAVQLAQSLEYDYVDHQGRILQPLPTSSEKQKRTGNDTESNADPQADPIATSAPPEATKSRRGRRSSRLIQLRRKLFLTRDRGSHLFDTKRWVSDLEKAYLEAWRRWVQSTDSEDSQEWSSLPGDHPARLSGHIWVDRL